MEHALTTNRDDRHEEVNYSAVQHPTVAPDRTYVTLIMDSGATVSIVNDRRLLRDIKNIPRMTVSGVGQKEVYS